MVRKVFRDQMEGESLDMFSQRCVGTPSGELSRLNSEVDEFVRFLQREFVGRTNSVAKVVKSGSLGKGTAVRNSADIDLVVFFNGLNSIYDLIGKRETLLDQIETGVSRYDQWRGRISRENRTQFSLKYKLDGNDVDLLPAFALDLNDDKRNRDLMYQHMEQVARKESKAKGDRKKGQGFVANQFSASLAPLQVAFVKHEDESVKKVIRLLKKWKKENGVADLRSYTVELVTIHTARAAGYRITTDDLFTRTLEVLAGCRSMRVYFKENYAVGQGGDLNSPWSHEPPHVMDVANPYNNTLHGANKQRISQTASATLRQLRS